jgi:hypothetical protein
MAREILAVGLLALALPARAEVIAGAGGALALDGPRLGAWAGAAISPGGPIGARADLWALEGQLLVEGALAVTLGATRPHLAVTLHAGAGADLSRAGVSAAAGMTTEIGLRLGPLVLILDATAHAVVWDERFDLVLTGVAGIGVVL